MIVCVCKAVNERAIHRAVAAGHDTLEDLQFELGLGTCCGKCVPMAREVLSEARLETFGAQQHAVPLRFVPRPTRVALA